MPNYCNSIMGSKTLLYYSGRIEIRTVMDAFCLCCNIATFDCLCRDQGSEPDLVHAIASTVVHSSFIWSMFIWNIDWWTRCMATDPAR